MNSFNLNEVLKLARYWLCFFFWFYELFIFHHYHILGLL